MKSRVFLSVAASFGPVFIQTCRSSSLYFGSYGLISTIAASLQLHLESFFAAEALFHASAIELRFYSRIGEHLDRRFADVLLTPSEDGYFMYVFYVSNTHNTFAGLQTDCIKK